jgi:hypothetical protein
VAELNRKRWTGSPTLSYLPHRGWYRVGSLVEKADGTRYIVVEIDPSKEAAIARVVDLFGADPAHDLKEGYRYKEA